MKKLVVTICLFAAMLFGMMSIPNTAVAAKPGLQVSATLAQKAKSKYVAYIKKHQIKSYKAVDIDGNGVPELLFFDSATLKQVVITYNAKTGKLVKLCSCKTGKIADILYKKSSHKVVLSFNSTGDNNYYVYTIKGTKAVRTGTYIAKRGSGFTWKRTINGKKVSDQVYWNRIQIFSKLSRVVYKYY